MSGSAKKQIPLGPTVATASTVLVVDDDIVAGQLLKLALNHAFTVESETSGANALSRAIAVKPQLILLDLHMPNVDGFEVLRQLRHHPTTAAIPIVCMSGDSEAASRERAISAGAVGYLLKPLDIKSLTNDLNSLLGSLHIQLSSPQGDRSFSIAFSAPEKYRAMERYLRALIDKNEKAIVLSLLEGAEFVVPSLREPVEAEQIVYLQIIPSLVLKFPYLQDVTSVVGDLVGFLSEPPENYTLLFDDPQVVLNFKDGKNAVARMHTLKEGLGGVFKRLAFFSSRDTSAESNAVLNEIASLFCR